MNEKRSAEMALRASPSSASRLTNLNSRSAVLAGLISAGGTRRSSAQGCATGAVTAAPVAASIAVVVPANFTKSRRDVVMRLLPTCSLKLHDSCASCQGELPLRLMQCGGIVRALRQIVRALRQDAKLHLPSGGYLRNAFAVELAAQRAFTVPEDRCRSARARRGSQNIPRG